MDMKLRSASDFPDVAHLLLRPEWRKRQMVQREES
jgi:hypothetical protein